MNMIDGRQVHTIQVPLPHLVSVRSDMSCDIRVHVRCANVSTLQYIEHISTLHQTEASFLQVWTAQDDDMCTQ